MAPTVLAPARIAVNAIAQNISKLEPIIKAVAPLVKDLANAFASWLERSNGLQRFVNVIVSQGVPAFAMLLTAGRNVLAVLGIGFRAFAGEMGGLARSIMLGSYHLRAWAEGGGFTRFIAFVNANAPKVRVFFDALKGALANI